MEILQKHCVYRGREKERKREHYLKEKEQPDFSKQKSIRQRRYYYNNKEKVLDSKKDHCKCGNKKDKRSKRCRDCYVREELIPRLRRENDKRYKEYEEMGL